MDERQPISEAEMEILQMIWQNDGPVLLAPLMEALEARGKSWKPNTVLTFLARLVEKGMLTVEKQGRLNAYHAQVSESEYMESMTRSFVGKVYGGDAKGLVASLLRQDCLSAADMAELQAFWNGGKDVK